MRPRTDHTWPNFKTHFEESYYVLRSVHRVTKRPSTYHCAKILDLQVLSEVNNVYDNILQALEIHITQIKPETEAVTPLPPQDQAVNATTSETVQLEMLRVIQELQREMNDLKNAGQGLGNFKK